MNPQPISTLGQLIETAAATATLFGVPEVWWRGYARADWTLTAGVYRDGRDWSYERNVSVRFFMKAHTRRSQCPLEGDWPSWLFLMQHYRLPTRLLDWTESPLVAAFFVVGELPDHDGALWALNPFALNASQTGEPRLVSPSGTVAAPLFLPPFIKAAPQQERTLAVIAKEIDIRMLVQQSAFTVHGATTPLETLKGADAFARKFTIPAASKRAINAQLEALGIRLYSLFPDLDHLARDLAGLRFE